MIKHLALFAFAFAVSLTAYATNTKTAGSKEIRILAYNIKGLPGIAGGYNKSRFNEIGKMLFEQRKNGTAPDFVLLQESFVNETDPVRSISQYPFVVKGPDKKNELDENGKNVSKMLNAGLYILSEHPLSNPNKVAYGKGICKTWDCNANKGLHSVVAEVPGLPFKLILINTHMQASNKHDAIRIQQMDIANRFIAKNNPTGAMIFAGDFNILPNLPSYSYWFKTSGLKGAGEYCLNPTQKDCAVKPGTDPAWVVEKSKDHQFFREGLTPTTDGKMVDVTITPLSIERNYTELHEGKPLSDHMGYEVVYRISWK